MSLASIIHNVSCEHAMWTMSMLNIRIRRRCCPIQQTDDESKAPKSYRSGCRRCHWTDMAGPRCHWTGSTGPRDHDGETTTSTGHERQHAAVLKLDVPRNQQVLYALHNSITRYTTLSVVTEQSLTCNGDMTNRPLRIVPASEHCRLTLTE